MSDLLQVDRRVVVPRPEKLVEEQDPPGPAPDQDPTHATAISYQSGSNVSV